MASLQRKLPVCATCNGVTWERAAGASMVLSSEFKKAKGEKVHRAICTGVTLLGCSICAAAVATASIANLIKYNVLDSAQTKSSSFSCRLAVEFVGGLL